MKTIGIRDHLLLSIVLAGLCLAAAPLGAQTFGVYRELWSGLSTSDASMALLTNNAAWPNSPNTNYTKIFTNFEAETALMDGYGERMRAYLTPPMDGDYVFWIASDDNSNLFLSSDESPANKALICYVSSYSGSREWAKEGNQMSGLIRLKAGKRVYIEAIMREAGGGDNLAVRWMLPNDVIEEPIPATSTNGTWMVPAWGDTNRIPGIYTQPVSTTVAEQGTALFLVGVTNPGPVSYQWWMNDAPLTDASARSSLLVISNTSVGTHDGKLLSCVISNPAGVVTSLVATLNVLPDTNPPVLLGVQNVSATNVMVAFSEPMNLAASTNPSNYSLDGGVLILDAVMYDPQTVLLTVSALIPDTLYTLAVTGLMDTATTPNPIAEDSRSQFTARVWAFGDVGSPALPSQSALAGSGLDVTAGGTDIGGTSDQFHFDYQWMPGDFDVQVRVAALGFTDLWSKAGLMARETLRPNSRFAAVLASPMAGGAFFEARTAFRNATAAMSGNFPVNYPNTWLRLQRATNVFTALASWDGQNWVRLGSATLDFTNCFLGFALSSHSAERPVTVQFRDYGPAAGGTVGVFRPPFEPMGPASRNIGLVISELMYHPRHSNDLEFVELCNASLVPEDLGGYRLAGDVHYTFPQGTLLPAGGYLVVARNPALLQAASSISGVLGPWEGAETNGLPDDQGVLRLYTPHGGLAFELTYRGAPPWPLEADGAGHSLVLARPSYGLNDRRAWAPSGALGGSPGRPETFTPEPLRSVVINEFLANSDAPQEDFVELFNHSAQPADLSGAWLSDQRGTNIFRIPDGTILEAGAFKSWTESQLGFALRSRGGRIFLVNSNQDRVIDAVDYQGTAAGVASGRCPDGGTEFRELAAPTPGGANSARLPREIVINEIMFHPVSGNDNDQFVELYNRGTGPVDVGGWRLEDAISFGFPTNTIIPPGGFLVVAKSAAHLLPKYPQLTPANTLGDFGGSLSRSGERLALSRPEPLASTNLAGAWVTNINWVLVNEVVYADQGRWSHWADGGGSSLELTDPNSDNQLAANWADSDESLKSEWTNVVASGLLDNVYPAAINAAGTLLNEFQAMFLGEGEALMDDASVQAGPAGSAAPNLVPNPAFNNKLTNWLIQGNHVRSSWEPAGPYSTTPCLHIRASSGGDNGANRIEADLASALTTNTVATLSARFRWLRGTPSILLRLHGGAMEASATLPVPASLGSPGLPNSRLVANAGPAIYDVTHSPIAPAPGQAVVVTARVSDPDGLASVRLFYRLDPSTNLAGLDMKDDGTGGDAVAGDGLYSATIPGQALSNLVAFHVSALDGAAAPARSLFPADAPQRECLVRFGDPVAFGAVPFYRLWVSATNVYSWNRRERLSNEPVDGTLAINDYRVIYNATGRYRGSPFIRPGAGVSPSGPIMMYILGTPSDDPFLGETELNVDSIEHGGRDTTGLREPMAFWMVRELGMPFTYQRPFHLVVNGVMDTTRGAPCYIDVQQPNSSYVSMWFPNDTQGDLFKIDDWFEYDHTVSMQGNKSASLSVFTTPSPSGPVKKTARYRWNFEKKANKGYSDDYTSLFAAANALSAPDDVYPEQVESIIDSAQWMTMLALRHVCGDWDGYGYNRGKNQFIYRPAGKRFNMLLWDLDFAFGCTGGHGPAQDLFSIAVGGADASDNMPEISRLYNHPRFRRAYFQALRRIADGPLRPEASGPRLDAWNQAFLANNIATVSPYVSSGAQGLSIPEWLRQRRVYIYQQLNAFTNMPFQVLTPPSILLASNCATLAGTAPLDVVTLEVNGAPCQITWTSTTNWSVRLPLAPGQNILNVQGFDRAGQPLASMTGRVDAVFLSDPEPPQGHVVINEVMFNPAVPNAEYVELFNVSSNTAYDLSGWRFNGLGYTFPAGIAIQPRGYLVLAKDPDAFIAAYDLNVPVFDYFSGNLQSDGETLALIKPGATAAADVIIDQVRYELAAPWPNGSNGIPTTASIQLVDPAQDNSRPGSWITRCWPGVYAPPVWTPAATNFGWRFMSVTGFCATVPKLLIYLDGRGDCYIDDVSVVNGWVPEAGPNLVRGGGFETAAVDTSLWLVGTNYTNSAISTDVKHSGDSGLHLVCASFGSTYGPPQGNKVFQQNLVPAPTNTQPLSLGLWYLSTTSATNLYVIMVNSTTLRMTNNLAPIYTPARYTPGYYSSAPVAGITPAQPNEALSNIVVNPEPLLITDSATVPTPAQPYPSALAVSGYRSTEVITRMSVQLSNLYHPAPAQLSLMLAAPDGRALVLMGKAGFYFPVAGATLTFDDAAPNILSSNAAITPKAWRPGDFNTFNPFPAPAPERSATNLAAFTGMNPNGVWSLYVVDDTLGNAGLVSNGWSLTFSTQDRIDTTPVWLNEVQPVNLSGWRDHTGQAAPWLELFNAGPGPLSLESCFLSDDYAQLDKWPLPAGATLQPGELRLVVCDGLTNLSTPEEWHASFKLDGASRAAALSQPLGGRLRVLDYLSFSNLADGLSYGAYPDGQPFKRQVFGYATPGLPNRPTPPPAPLRINEWMAANGRAVSDPADAKYQDWFELYNPTALAVSLDGWALTHTLDTRRHFEIPNGYTLPAHGFLLVWADDQTNQNTAAAADLHANFKLNKDGSLIALSAPDGTLVDQVVFGTAQTDISQGRYPDGSADIYSMPGYTPRGPNVVPMLNTAPVLAPIADLAVNEGSLVTTTAEVTDTDQPAQQMTFSLEPGAPEGAAITAGGVFHWRPSELFGPGVYPVTIRVTDSGTPRLSATAAFQVTVREVNVPPVFPDTRDRYASVGVPIQFATAADTDWPAQTLAVEVVGTLPEGAALDPLTGVFSWTPAEAQAAQDFTLQVRATDNGAPSLSATALYTLHVLPAGSAPLVVEITPRPRRPAPLLDRRARPHLPTRIQRPPGRRLGALGPVHSGSRRQHRLEPARR